MESNEISIHQARVFLALTTEKWMTAQEIHDATQVAARTVRDHLLTFVNMGIVDRAEVFPGHRYRLSSMADKRNKTYAQRLQDAVKVFGLDAQEEPKAKKKKPRKARK